MLRQHDSELFTASAPLTMLGLHLGTRMTVVRLSGGGLFVHSPITLDSELRAELDALGPVVDVVAPNLFHHLFVGPYRDAYPAAKLFGAPGLATKRADVHFDAVLGSSPDPLWLADLEQIQVEGMKRLRETVFFHAATRTLITSDLLFNVGVPAHLGTRLYARAAGTYDRVAVSRLVRLVVDDPAHARRSIDAVLGWDFDRVILAHGEVVETGGKALFRAAWEFLEA